MIDSQRAIIQMMVKHHNESNDSIVQMHSTLGLLLAAGEELAILQAEIERLQKLAKWTEMLYKPLPHDPMP